VKGSEGGVKEECSRGRKCLSMYRTMKILHDEIKEHDEEKEGIDQPTESRQSR
jgi:hypothetical protein